MSANRRAVEIEARCDFVDLVLCRFQRVVFHLGQLRLCESCAGSNFTDTQTVPTSCLANDVSKFVFKCVSHN